MRVCNEILYSLHKLKVITHIHVHNTQPEHLIPNIDELSTSIMLSLKLGLL